jgi:protocatechuate 3,4-dioxygenase beta subunit
MKTTETNRRSILMGWLAASTVGFAMFALKPGNSAQAQTLAPTLSCGPDEEPTSAATEGPYFTPDTPAKRDFRQDAPGEALTLMGFVVDRDCRPIENALVDLWHADAQGDYDNDGYRLRGHQLTDAQGRYVFDTIVPGRYDGRTRHFHVKVQPAGGRLLTTQLYFPGEPGNGRDSLFDPLLLMRIENASDGMVGRFDFVLDHA